MTTADEAEELKRLELTEIFHQTLVPVSEMPGVRALFDACAQGLAPALAEAFSLEADAEIERIVQLPAYEALSPSAGLLAAVFHVAEWNAQLIIGCDRTLLFRALDSMYGGDGRLTGPPPTRQLTPLEQSIAEQFAKVVIGQFQELLAPYVSFGFALDRVEQAFDPEAFVGDRSELVVVALRLEALDERLIVALPVRGLELVRDQLSAPQEEAQADLDPTWSRNLERNIFRTEVDLLAVADGPPMLLGDIARLQPGALIEFDAGLLEYVRIESDGEAVFEGQLGQSKGFLSVCVERPLPARAVEEPKASATRRHA